MTAGTPAWAPTGRGPKPELRCEEGWEGPESLHVPLLTQVPGVSGLRSPVPEGGLLLELGHPSVSAPEMRAPTSLEAPALEGSFESC